jgi:hypothetical protein
MTAVEEALYQTKNRARQDPLNFPIRLTNKLGHLNSLMRGDYPPTKQAIQVKEELTKEIDDWLAKYYEVRDQKVPQFNKLIRELEVDVLTVPKSE